jgi:hypothetical protein
MVLSGMRTHSGFLTAQGKCNIFALAVLPEALAQEDGFW